MQTGQCPTREERKGLSPIFFFFFFFFCSLSHCKCSECDRRASEAGSVRHPDFTSLQIRGRRAKSLLSSLSLYGRSTGVPCSQFPPSLPSRSQPRHPPSIVCDCVRVRPAGCLSVSGCPFSLTLLTFDLILFSAFALCYFCFFGFVGSSFRLFRRLSRDF